MKHFLKLSRSIRTAICMLIPAKPRREAMCLLNYYYNFVMFNLLIHILCRHLVIMSSVNGTCPPIKGYVLMSMIIFIKAYISLGEGKRKSRGNLDYIRYDATVPT